jgi:hypothetical protein
LLQESVIIAYICIIITIKNDDMIATINPETGNMTYYRSLIDACKMNKQLKYHTLRDKKLSTKRTLYKDLWIYRIKYY